MQTMTQNEGEGDEDEGIQTKDSRWLFAAKYDLVALGTTLDPSA